MTLTGRATASTDGRDWAEPRIGAGEAHVWVADPDALDRDGTLGGYRATLSQPERDRAAAFRSEADRLAFEAAHGLARAALTWCAPAVTADAWRFTTTPHGRPEITGQPPLRPLRFNISHTAGLVACVITLGAACGVDAERVHRRADPLRLGRRVCSPAEYARLVPLDDPDARADLFFRYWTLKEAYVKARGYGMTLPMNQCDFEIAASVPAGTPTTVEGRSVARFGPRLRDDPARWRFAQWRPGPRHLLALAVRREPGLPCALVVHPAPPPVP
ncbi:4'-phosphopantetheinyl transferase family protein [Microbispora siamensis]